ncbi:BppU family phage baseplate upper protein [Bacillus velezensis]|uniref:phage baseplate upper protein n=1 Tax=Bacillus velezensis TaxID=492670 RepID=UPI001560BB4D|nr:phage baseplate upper protein [Bacillus velezensis]MCY9463997.1 BppU family phage baseplate upper protein [Bacillus velezensis]MEC2269350.1 BppU family phage baseplate upper protein [Bacillus velezensis]MEC3794584.1 BppU family phage baseplate upper protein [Bacillus velezensis]MED3681242.1 BppU family phage baseplate upper protein [Bacillus velezensis]NRF35989.1 BppU family phage baseplate upper protein [Bacillus velezensis]
MYKTGSVPININTNPINGRSTNIQFMTQDTGSAKLFFSFTKDSVPLPLSAVDAKIVLLYDDGSFYKKSLTITDKVNGTAEYVLSNAELKHYGTVKAEIKLYYTNGQALATSFFTFSIAKTLEDQNIIPTADYYIDDFETLRDGINHIVEEISQTVEELQKKFADLEAIETKEGAQQKADDAEEKARAYTDEHANDEEKHITAAERKAWNAKETPSGAQKKVDAHANDQEKHVSAADRKAWDAKETPSGAQDKVNLHANNTDIHVTAEDQAYWDDMTRQFKAHNYNQERHISAVERKTWNGAATYANIMLKNGATAGTRTPIYAKWGPLILLRGHVKTDAEIIFGSIPAEYAPAGGSVITVPLSGTGGTANLIIYDNGDLKIKYPDPADSSKMGGGYYLDVVVGFQEGGTA